MDNQPFDFTQLFETTTSLTGALFLYGVFLRIMFFLAFAVYGLFAAIVVRQVYLMDGTIKTPLAPLLKLLAWAHLLLVLALMALVFVAL